jgi:hypothetical protein
VSPPTQEITTVTTITRRLVSIAVTAHAPAVSSRTIALTSPVVASTLYVWDAEALPAEVESVARFNHPLAGRWQP